MLFCVVVLMFEWVLFRSCDNSFFSFRFFLVGDQCEQDIDDCAGVPCANGATCVDGFETYTCTCQEGYTDADCSTDINECMFVCE